MDFSSRNCSTDGAAATAAAAPGGNGQSLQAHARMITRKLQPIAATVLIKDSLSVGGKREQSLGWKQQDSARVFSVNAAATIVGSGVSRCAETLGDCGKGGKRFLVLDLWNQSVGLLPWRAGESDGRG